MKMKQVYESNPALGDPLSIQGQLTENGHRLDKLRSELKKFQVKSKTMAIMKKHKSPFFKGFPGRIGRKSTQFTRD